MKAIRFSAIAASLLLAATSMAQPFQWPASYAPTAKQGGTINITLFGDITTLNPVLMSSASESALLGANIGGPGIIHRDWLGNRAFKNGATYNMTWASAIEEVRPEQEYIVTLREGWHWSDGEVMDVDDLIAAHTIIGDPDVESNNFSCTDMDGEKVTIEKISQYQFRLITPEPTVNALANKLCPTIPSHIYMPIYEASGAEGIKAMWGVDADVSTIVSGGPYLITEFSPGERIVLTRNPEYGKQVQAADGSPLPGPDSMVITFVEDVNAQLARVVTGQADYFYPNNLDHLAAINDAKGNSAINGDLFANIGPDRLVDFITYNFNNTDSCKAEMFRNPTFRQAISIAIDRQALVEAALGGLGFPAKDYNSPAAAPFDAPHLDPFEFNPERAVEMLNGIGFTDYDEDGVLYNPETGCRVAFELQFNSGNNRRSQEALVISQTAEPFGIKITPREVSTDIWADSITGGRDYDETNERPVDYDAQIWGLAGGDVDNPHSVNVVGLQENLNAWNKSKVDVEAWEILMDRLSRNIQTTLDLNERIALYNERADVMREYLPMTPLISPAFHFYTDLGNMWPEDKMDASSIASPYNPGNFISLIAVR